MVTQLDMNRQFLYMFLHDIAVYVNKYSLSLTETQKDAFRKLYQMAKIVNQRYKSKVPYDPNNKFDVKANSFYEEFRKRNESICIYFFEEKYNAIAAKYGTAPYIPDFWIEIEEKWNAEGHTTPLFIPKNTVRTVVVKFNGGDKEYEYLYQNASDSIIYPDKQLQLIQGASNNPELSVVKLQYYDTKPDHVTKALRLVGPSEVIALSL